MSIKKSSDNEIINFSMHGCHGHQSAGCRNHLNVSEKFQPNRVTPITRMFYI